MEPVYLALERVSHELRERLEAEAESVAAGGAMSGGIKAMWRDRVREIADLMKQQGPGLVQTSAPPG